VAPVRWPRRAFLRALSTSAAASALAPLVGGACGGPAGPDRAAVQRAARPVPALRDELRRQVRILSERLPEVSALATIERVTWVLVDSDERSLQQIVLGALVLTAADRDQVLEEVVTDLGPAGIARAAAALASRAAAGARPFLGHRALPAPLDATAPPGVAPGALAPAAWLAPVEALYGRARAAGASRIVHRAAYAVCDDSETVFVNMERDVAQRLVRTRAGVLFLSQDTRRRAVLAHERGDTALRVEEVGQGGLEGLEAAALPDAALARAADRVLTLFAPTPPPQGLFDVVLAPEVAARIVRDCVAPALCSDAWLDAGARAAALAGQRVGAEAVTLIDDPRAAGAYGAYSFDDEGLAGAASPLIEAGVLRGPLTDRRGAELLGVRRTASARRAHATAAVGPAPSNLVLVPGRVGRDALIGGVAHGYLLEGCRLARTHLPSWRFAARLARAYEIRRGKLTGVVHADIDLTGDIPGLLQEVRALSADAERFCYGGGGTLATSATCPYVWTRGQIAGG
jgi:predicted Zn-dependent protease